jgi:branched-chain amino acid transport system permease protein
MLIALSFSIVYNVTKVFYFAHGILFTSGAYFLFFFTKLLFFPLWISYFLAVLASILLACTIEYAINKPLRKSKASLHIQLLSSLGVYIVLQNLISLIFGDETKSIRTWAVVEGINIFGARISYAQSTIVLVSVLLTIVVGYYLNNSKIGHAMKAIASDSELAIISGINIENIILYTFVIGSALSSVAGILISIDIDMTPTMGMNALMSGIVVMIVGGIGRNWGIVLGSLLLAAAQNLVVWYVNSQWQEAIAFAILLIFLLFKPEGFLGKKIKNAINYKVY